MTGVQLDEKSKARQAARRVRAAVSPKNKSEDLLSHWPKIFDRKSVAGYWPIKDELDPRPLMEMLSSKGHLIGLPAILKTDHPLEFRDWFPESPLVEGPYNTFEPASDASIMLPDVVLVPMLAFNMSGDRLGYGGGFYDRTLSKLRGMKPVFACGVAFSEQQMKLIPTNNFDEPLDGILTERYFEAF